MIRNYITVAFRNFFRQKSYTLLNVAGLFIGIAATILILQYVKYEKSFDTFHSRYDDIYRVQYNGWKNGVLNFNSATAVPAVGPALKHNFPEVEDFTRSFPSDGVVTYESPIQGLISSRETKVQFTGPAFLRIFDFPLIKGDRAHCLQGVNKVIISEQAAEKYFGEADPLGKVVRWNGAGAFEVTGVFKDVPANSHIRFNFLFSFDTFAREQGDAIETSWTWYDFYTYVMLKPGTDIKKFQAKWNRFLAQSRSEDWKKTNSFQEFILQPLRDIHLYSDLMYEIHPNDQRDGEAVNALGVIAFFILVIAWINYVNLATARSANRAREVGVRKAAGAQQWQLTGQFLIESVILNFIAVAIAIVMVRLVWPAFSELSGWKLPVIFMRDPDFWMLAIALLAGGALVSGLYPALVLSSFKPSTVLKGRFTGSPSGSYLRKSLVIFQFVSSTCLIIGSVTVYQQLRFMQRQNLGINIEETVVLKTPAVYDSTFFGRIESFKNEVVSIPGVVNLTTTNSIPGDEIFWTSHFRRMSGPNEKEVVVANFGIDDQSISAFGIPILEGRNFNKQFKLDHKKVLLNQAMAELLEFKDMKSVVGEKLLVRQSTTLPDTFEIVGVTANFHQMSLKEKISPIVFRFVDWSNYFAIKGESLNNSAMVEKLESAWKEFFPADPMDYFYLDQFFNRQYEKEERFGKTFNFFTALAVLIAALGLFGLASFMSIQRTKEIGVRKVLGAPVYGIVVLLSKDFIKPVIIANLIAWPLSWYFLDRWLQSFPYKIDLSPFVFVLSSLSVVLVAFIAVSSQTIEAALAQPAKTLKYE